MRRESCSDKHQARLKREGYLSPLPNAAAISESTGVHNQPSGQSVDYSTQDSCRQPRECVLESLSRGQLCENLPVFADLRLSTRCNNRAWVCASSTFWFKYTPRRFRSNQERTWASVYLRGQHLICGDLAAQRDRCERAAGHHFSILLGGLCC
jgi:hypothetical protein